MPRKPTVRPWLHAPSGFWCATINGKRVYLDRDARVAERKLRQLRTEQKRNSGVLRDWLQASFAELADEFLSDLKARRKPGTYEQARYCLLRALTTLGTRIRVAELRRIHLAKVEQALVGKYGPSSIRETLAKVQQVYSWAIEHELLDVNPLVGYRKPAKRSRTRVITPAEFQSLLRASATNPAFRRALIALRWTGCRPGELRSLTWEWSIWSGVCGSSQITRQSPHNRNRGRESFLCRRLSGSFVSGWPGTPAMAVTASF